jgi:hypothetical protein
MIGFEEVDEGMMIWLLAVERSRRRDQGQLLRGADVGREKDEDEDEKKRMMKRKTKRKTKRKSERKMNGKMNGKTKMKRRRAAGRYLWSRFVQARVLVRSLRFVGSIQSLDDQQLAVWYDRESSSEVLGS